MILDAMEEGLTSLILATDELTLDVPSAPQDITLFLARSLIDQTVHPGLLARLPAWLFTSRSDLGKTSQEVQAAVAVVAAAQRLLSAPHGTARVLRAWGQGDAGTVGFSKAHIRSLLDEYVIARDRREAARCLRDLRCPFFHHEFVKQLAFKAVSDPEQAPPTPPASAPTFLPEGPAAGEGMTHAEDQLQEGEEAGKGGEPTEEDKEVVEQLPFQGPPRKLSTRGPAWEALLSLLAYLLTSAIVSRNQLKVGWLRCVEAIEEFELDVPGSRERLRNLLGIAHMAHISVPPTLCLHQHAPAELEPPSADG